MRACKYIVFLVLSLFICSAAYANRFNGSVRVIDRLTDKERQLFKETGCSLMGDADNKVHVTVALGKDDAPETYAAQQADIGLADGAECIVFLCRKITYQKQASMIKQKLLGDTQ